jgi:hypothetical protein
MYPDHAGRIPNTGAQMILNAQQITLIAAWVIARHKSLSGATQAGSQAGEPSSLQDEALPGAGLTNPLAGRHGRPSPSSLEKPAGEPTPSLLAKNTSGAAG